MYRQNAGYSRKSNGRKRWILLVVIALVALGLAWFFVLRDSSSDQASSDEQNNTEQEATPAPEPEEQKPPLVDLQPTVDAWLAGQSADFGIVVYDPANKKVIAKHQPDQQYFAASLYKLFVAYLALVDFQNGTQDPNEDLTDGYTRKECVDLMIRDSHSPCGEAMMASMGQEALATRVAEMDINNTVFAGITTTAQDSALILQYILEKRDLNDANTEFLKEAMRVQDQRFRNGLAKGAPDATWETKVGWNEQYNYHDVGIMTLKNGRQYVVAILSLNNGQSAPITDFAATIYDKLNN